MGRRKPMTSQNTNKKFHFLVRLAIAGVLYFGIKT
jgi:hypothetical protein